MESETSPRNVGSQIDRILRRMSTFTCLSFKQNRNYKVENTIGINFFVSTNNTNTVSLSNNTSYPTTITLKEDTYKNGTLLRFYIGIAFDIIPEVRRYDRNIDVNVTMNNVKEEFQQFYEITNPGDIPYLINTEFDFKSPMFFGPDFGNKTNEPTYTISLYNMYEYFLSSNKIFRFNDYKHIFYYYCEEERKKQNDCEYGGYYHKQGAKECTCPEYLGNKTCKDFNKKGLDINYTIADPLRACSQESVFEANITKAIHYINITSEKDKNVSVTIKEIKFEGSDCLTRNSYMEVLVRNDKGAAGINICNNSSNEITLPSLSNEVFIVTCSLKYNTFLKIGYKASSEGNDNNITQDNS
uniref:Astacin domain-containing protein n=1 Tax=Strongyloides papillosus TaxID=174720 RepID=A0A0N5BS43_STREA